MPAGPYPFIDIAVHDQIRTRFARGEALVLFTADLDEVLWADGEGASLFGFATPYELMDDWSTAPRAMHRQLQAAAALMRRSDAPQTAMLRLTGGTKSRLVPVSLLGLQLSDGRPAVLLAQEAGAEGLDLAARAGRIVAGLGDAATHVAVFDGQAAMLAASGGFPDPGDDPALPRDLIDRTAAGRNRLTKRMVTLKGRSLPAAIARLDDDPALYLLFVLETEEGPATSGDGGPDGEAAPAARPKESRAPALNAWSLDPRAMAGRIVEPQPAADGETGQPVAPASPPAFAFQPDGKPVRFAWKIDADGCFKELSSDFAAAVGPNAADVIGRRFEDVAKVFGFDRDNGISDLLKRRDTWSGRSVSWPVQGTDLAVPVELAALPTYTADREFDGFKGFGIARIGEAEKDPEAIGLSLVSQVTEPPAAPEEPEAGTSETIDEPAPDARPAATANSDEARTPQDNDTAAEEEDPFRGEKPALKIVKPFGRRPNDKVIDLDEHRPRTREVLSSVEQQAFREIGERLAKSFGPEKAGEDAPAAGKETAPEQAAPVAANTSEPGGNAPGLPAASASAGSPEDVPGETAAPAASEDAGPVQEAAAPRSDALPSAFATAGRGRETGQLSEDIVDDLPLAVLLYSGETLHHANAEFLALTGHDDLDALTQAGGLEALFDAPGNVAGDDVPGTLRLMRADGAETAVRARLKSVSWHDGRALMLSLVPAHDDAAARETAEDAGKGATNEKPAPAEAIELPAPVDPARTAALEIEVEELRSILETATDGVVILGDNGEIRSMNRSASALFDYDEAETRGQPFAKLFAHESQRAVMDYLNGLREHGVASVLNDGREVIGREASGGFLPLFMTIGRLTGSNGYCAVMRDITQWKRTEEDLRTAKFAAEQANAHKSEFLARVSHEIRTPLNAIIGFSEMMSEQRFGPIGSPRYLEYAHDIGQSGKHVLDIVNDLLDISKIEAGEMEVSFSAVALNDTIAEAVSLMQPQANSQRVIIRTSLSSSVPEIVADQRSIKQIALNLLSNAIRFTPAGGQIVVSSAYEESGSVVLRIRDTGVGMSRGELDQAMKPFRQVQGTTSRPRGDGTGLGLPLTKAMVEANRAEFDIRSAPGEGTLIEITFPSQRVLAD